MTKCLPSELLDSIKERARNGEITADDITKMLPTERAALKVVLEEFVTEKLGVKVSTEEINQIQVRAQKIDAAQKALGDDLGNPAKTQENVAFFMARKSMDDYLNSLNPSNRVKVLTSTVGRGVMLLSVKSPVLNIGTNTEAGITEALSRRLASGQFRGADNALAMRYVKMVNKVYQASGYDLSRMVKLQDSGASGERVLGDIVHSEGTGRIRAAGRLVQDIVFKQLMGAPDVAFSSAHFADSVNLNAMQIAEGNKKKAQEFMEDSMRLEPQTPEGALLRAQGILDAQTATWTNDSWATQVSLGIRKILNDVSGDARVGDYVFPFVKTPANVIATGMDYAGMGVPKALVDTYKAYKTGKLGNKQYRQRTARNLVRSGLGLTAAVMLAAMFDDDDFVGAYDPARAQIEQLRGSNYNAFRVGGKWISTDWLGPLAVPFTAIMYGRKYSDTTPEGIFQYGKGVLSQVKNLPGISDTYDYVRGQVFAKNQSFEEMAGSTWDYILSQAYTRLIPSFVSDVAKATDSKERVAKGTIQVIKNKIPGLRQTLPERKDIFGDTVRGEPAWSDIFFGARVKTDKENETVKELSNLSTSVGKGITFTNWDTSSSKTLAQFKEKVGNDRFDEAKGRYGQELKRMLESTVRSSAYRRATAEDKLKLVNALDSTVMNKVFKQYGFKYKPPK